MTEALDRAVLRLAQNLVLQAELSTLVANLEERGIDVIVLKGIPLALRLFGSIAARDMVDNDLLVRRDQAIRAVEILGAAGYRSFDSREIASQLALDYQFRMSRPLPKVGALCAEVHWNAFSNVLYPVPEGVLWAHVESFTANGSTFRVFDPPLTLVHLAAHFAQSDFAVRQILLDVAAAWNLWYADCGGDAPIALAREIGLADVLDFALLSAADLRLLKSPPPAIGSKRARRLRRLLPAERLCVPRPTPDYARWFLGLLLVDPVRVPIWFRNAMFPPVENLAAIEGRPLSQALRWRHLIRPFRALGRAVGGRGARVSRG